MPIENKIHSAVLSILVQGAKPGVVFTLAFKGILGFCLASWCKATPKACVLLDPVTVARRN